MKVLVLNSVIKVILFEKCFPINEMLRILADAIYLEYTINILAAIITDFNSVTFTLSSSTAVLLTVNKGWMLATVK